MANIKQVSRVRLDDYDKHVNSSWKALQFQNQFSDVTLVCGDKPIHTHKFIISSCSPVFRSICEQNSNQSTVIYLRGINYTDMSNLLSFMYQGQADVSQDDLNSFLAVAEDLEIKGLCNETSSNVNEDTIAIPDIRDEVLKPSNINGVEMEIKSGNKELVLIDDNLDNGEDLDQYIKHEIRQNVPTNEEHLNDLFSDVDQHLEQATNIALKSSPEYYPNIKEFMEDQTPTSLQLSVETDMVDTVPISEELISNLREISKIEEKVSKRKYLLTCVPCKTHFDSNVDLKQHKESVHKNSSDPNLYTCDKCGHKTAHKHNLKKHMESIHLGIRYPCTQCSYKATQKVSLKLHMKSMHK